MNTNSTDFACLVTGFLTDYLPHHRCYSRNTILSYRDTLKLFLRFLKEEKENILKTRKLNKIQIIRISIIYSPFSNLCIVFKASCQVGTEKPIASVFFILNVEL